MSVLKGFFNKELNTVQLQSSAPASLPLWPTSQSLPRPTTVVGLTIMKTLQDCKIHLG